LAKAQHSPQINLIPGYKSGQKKNKTQQNKKGKEGNGEKASPESGNIIIKLISICLMGWTGSLARVPLY